MTDLYSIDQLRFAYDWHPVLSIDHLSIDTGTVTALIGPNGSGKSTLLKLFAFLIFPGQGELKFKGIAGSCGQALALRRRVGLVSQNPYFFHGNVLHNIEVGLRLHGIDRKAAKLKGREVLARIGMDAFASVNVRELSGGEAQKVALARALALDPEVLLFDEPFTFLDQNSISMTENIFVEFRKERSRSVIFSTHDQMHGLAISDQSISLMSGKVAPGPLVNLFRGSVKAGIFSNAKVTIVLPGDVSGGSHLSVDPWEIVLSRNPIDSSIRNVLQGRITAIVEDRGRARVSVRAGEIFNVLITDESLKLLGLTLGQSIWIGFKSTAVKVF